MGKNNPLIIWETVLDGDGVESTEKKHTLWQFVP